MRTLVFTLLILLLSGQAKASPEKSCNDLLSNQIDRSVRTLAELRFDLDLQMSQGKESMVTRALTLAFESKYIQALNVFSSDGLTSELLKSKIESEIKKIQGEHVEVVNENEFLKQLQTNLAEKYASNVAHIGNLEIPVADAAQANLPNGKILVVSGDRSVQWIDPATGKSETLLQLNHARVKPKIWVLSDGSVLVAGGGRPEIELISADLKTVTDIGIIGKGKIHVKNASHEGFLSDGTLLLVAIESSQWSSSMTYLFYQFDPVSKAMKRLGKIGGFEEKRGMSILPDGTVVMSGGLTVANRRSTDARKTLTSAIEKVDAFAIPTYSQKWFSHFLPRQWKYRIELFGDMGRVLYDHQQILLNDGRILMVGGRDFSEVQSEIGIFDPSLKEYRRIGELSEPRDSGFVLTLLPDGRVIVTGGVRDSQPVSTIEVIDPELNTVSALTALTVGRGKIAVTVISDKEVILTGGAHGDHKVGVIEKLKVGDR